MVNHRSLVRFVVSIQVPMQNFLHNVETADIGSKNAHPFFFSSALSILQFVLPLSGWRTPDNIV